MKPITHLAVFLLAAWLLPTACTKDPQKVSYEEQEHLSLEAYMTQHHPDLVENYQSEGGYYVEILDQGAPDAKPVGETAQWVRFDFSGRNLNGDIVLTRSEKDATLMNTFTKYTHYVPYYRYLGKQNTQLSEGTWLAMHDTLTLGADYFAAHGAELGLTAPQYQMRIGSKVRLYLPSSVSGDMSGDGGYQGQFSLDDGKPCIITMQITDTVVNPLQREGQSVDDFAATNGGVQLYGSKDDPAAGIIKRPTDPDDANHPYNIAARWVSANDTIPQLYVNLRATPTEQLTFKQPYTSIYEPYNAGVASIDSLIAKALQKRFYPDSTAQYAGVKALDTTYVTTNGTANIWYIGRFLDGFIFDTNIDEVKKIIYGEVTTKGTALSYTPSSGDMIKAFEYVVPDLKFGQWATLITTSTQAYGASGSEGSMSTTTTGGDTDNSYYDYLNYMNYANSYYGDSGMYGGYYGGYYGGLGGMYGGYYGGYPYDYEDTTTTPTVTTTTVSTEILPFTPLIFQIYVEPKAN